MIHLRWPPICAFVLEVALAATLDVGVKRGWLALQQSLIVGMAGGATDGLNALDRRVAGYAVVLQRCVRGGKLPRTDLSQPDRRPHHTSLMQNAPQRNSGDQDEEDNNPFFHLNHLSPK
jgi:hypothetical protein